MSGEQSGCDECVRLRNANTDLLAACKELLTGIEKWNAAVEAVIGRQPDTGLGLERIRAAIALAEGTRS